MGRIASTTKNYVVIARPAFEELMARKARTERLARELRRQADDVEELLYRALHELARERGRGDHAHFTRRWLEQARRQEPPIPLAPRGGGDAQERE